MKQKSVHELFQPSKIGIEEQYVYQSDLTGAQSNILTKASGEIAATILYDQQKEQRFLSEARSHISHKDRFWKSSFGCLKINEYGRSNLNSHLQYNWDRDHLPLEIDSKDYRKVETEIGRSNRFNFILSHNYVPDKPLVPPIEIGIELLDDDYFKNPQDTIEKTFLDELGKRMNLKRNLILRFDISLTLSKQLGQRHEDKPPVLSNMTLTWPISTPYYLADVYADRFLTKPKAVTYDPEQSQIEWENIPFHFVEVQEQTGSYIFKTERIRLEIREPSEIYEVDKLIGSTTVKLNNLLSEMSLEYENDNFFNKLPVNLQSVIVNNFTLTLSEALKRKSFLPSQHLHFSGIIFSDMRLADIVMLLEDKGFQLSKRNPLIVQDPKITEEHDKNKRKPKRYTIKAERLDGFRKLEIEIQVQAADSNTTREREILGKEKYTTDLPIGHADILILGKMKGDHQYIIREVNELQQRLKEHFGYVSVIG